jgi:hypothetical protein
MNRTRTAAMTDKIDLFRIDRLIDRHTTPPAF